MNTSFSIFVVTGSLLGVMLLPAGCKRQTEPGGLVKEKEPAAAEESKELSVAEIFATRCSHGLTIECAECRYEVGVVKVDAALRQAEGSAVTGLVRTIRAAKMLVQSSIRVAGEVAVNEEATVHVSPPLAGTIRGVAVDIGAHVAKGAVLFSMDSVEIGQAVSDYVKNLALTELAGKTLQRDKNLHAQKIGSESEVIAAQMAFEEHQASLKAAELRLRILGLTAEDVAAWRAAGPSDAGGALPVRAPIAGTVIAKHAMAGEFAEPGRDAMVVTDLGALWIWGGLYERDLAPVLTRLSAGPIPATITVPAFPDLVFTGQLNHVAATMDEDTRTVKVRIVVANPGHLLRPGMFASCRLLLSSDEEILAVPPAALLADEGVDFLFKHMKDDYFLRQNVKKGRAFEQAVEIVAGLTPGETIVSEGAFLLKSDVLRSKMGAGCAD